MTSLKEQVVACVQDLASQTQRRRELGTEKTHRMIQIGRHQGFDVHVMVDWICYVKDGKTL